MALGKGDTRARPDQFSVEGYLHVQGRADFHYAADPVYSFDLKRGRIKFDYSYGSALRTEIEIACDELNLTIKDAYLEYRISPLLGFTAGLSKMPFSREELTAMNRLLAIERTTMNDEMGRFGYLGRDIGLAVTGLLSVRHLPISYAVGVYNGNQAAAFQDNDNTKQFAERLAFEPSPRLTLGLNATERSDSVTGRLQFACGGDLSWRPGGATIEAEVLSGEGDANQTMLGGYLSGAYRFGTLEPLVRVECLLADLARPVNRTAAVTAGLNWYLHKRFGIKINVVADTKPGQELGGEARVQLQAGF